MCCIWTLAVTISLHEKIKLAPGLGDSKGSVMSRVIDAAQTGEEILSEVEKPLQYLILVRRVGS